ncbi:MAG: DUF4136 domain-containing protein [Acidovorax sp.]|jgi:hypothetical protein|nr:DUF4136 domain-containing protein [Acidovorax sp.]
MRWITLPLLCAALWLTGCASTRLVDSDVQSFSQLAGAPARATYSFERLPSQQAQGAQQSAVEEQARLALAKVGLRQDSAAPFYRVQAHARTDLLAYPDYWDGPGWGWGGWGGGRGFYGGLSMRFPPPTLYRREVGLILREAATGNVVYETRAVHEGVWTDNPAVFAAMFDAALNGFPTPPTGPRRIVLEIPR